MPFWGGANYTAGRRMKVRILAVAVVFGLLNTGCTSQQRSLDRRRLDAIELIEKHHLDRSNPFMDRQARETLNGLLSSTAESLKKPCITFAGLNRNGALTLLVTWVEDSPSVDAVEYRIANGRTLSLVIDEEEKAELRKQAIGTVQFVKLQKFESDSAITRSFGAAGGMLSIDVRLRTSKQPATDWFPVWIWPSIVEL